MGRGISCQTGYQEASWYRTRGNQSSPSYADDEAYNQVDPP